MASEGKALGYGITFVGVVMAWAALINRSVIGTLQDLVAGKQPTAGPGFQVSKQVPGGTGSLDPSLDTGSVSGNVQAYARQLFAMGGWAGPGYWEAFTWLVASESSWNPLAENKTTGAFGLAQALNHGTGSTASPTRIQKYGSHAGQHVNMYGGYGLSDGDAQRANSGSPYAQIVWEINYIKATYGDPIKAKEFHQQHGWY